MSSYSNIFYFNESLYFNGCKFIVLMELWGKVGKKIVVDLGASWSHCMISLLHNHFKKKLYTKNNFKKTKVLYLKNLV